MRLRTARPDDLPALDALITDSARGLSRGDYTPEQIESLLQYVFGADTPPASAPSSCTRTSRGGRCRSGIISETGRRQVRTVGFGCALPNRRAG
jgi:hypothetical protein